MASRVVVWLLAVTTLARSETSNRQVPAILPRDCGRKLVDVSKAQWISPAGRLDDVAYYGEYPWQARLDLYDNRVKSFQHRCGAVIIGSRHVLTSGSCVNRLPRRDLLVRVGRMTFGRQEVTAERFGVARIQMHQDFNPAHGYANDIALLHLRTRPDSAEGIRFDQYIQPACLPLAGATIDATANLHCVTSGWGSDSGDVTEVLRGLVVKPVSDVFCAAPEVYGGAFAPGLMTCASLKNPNEGPCHGDPGGPLVCKNSGSDRFILQGITSNKGHQKCDDGPGVYTKVSSYVDWILNSMEFDLESPGHVTSNREGDPEDQAGFGEETMDPDEVRRRILGPSPSVGAWRDRFRSRTPSRQPDKFETPPDHWRRARIQTPDPGHVDPVDPPPVDGREGRLDSRIRFPDEWFREQLPLPNQAPRSSHGARNLADTSHHDFSPANEDSEDGDGIRRAPISSTSPRARDPVLLWISVPGERPGGPLGLFLITRQ